MEKKKNQNRFNGDYSDGTLSSHENWRRTEVERWHGAHRGRIVRWRARAHAYTHTHNARAQTTNRTRLPYAARKRNRDLSNCRAHTHVHMDTHTHSNTHSNTRAPVKRLRFTRKLFDKCQVQDYKSYGPELGI